ncbi:hypothetical protein PP564_13950 [Mycobacteroides abscessus]|uniref:hypothetical protein n=1 Tax=Mycobacteroides abscessus TaxID=36809 RepID=UPI000C260E2E|nr:hypothetical protein [Mycobacteroides abscessus]MDM2493487.1 hypothetical protein [Mycobacteroides abscessus]MDM2514433.1 hypothetical protein [Mycobacteroides abscessus]MDM2523779.1 hypothetical protein [Mycobacteroides abscessus]MDM2528202.1 hypothetical protein [Mycobacteroides abscessus]MDM2531553.1 hypothetical protein [Mycobacteroides abscessus]
MSDTELNYDSDMVDAAEQQAEPDTFDRQYVEKLRKENADHRTRADEVSRRLHTELVRVDGRLADPADLPYDRVHVDNPEALTLAIDELLESKPHFASRVPAGHVGQGEKDAGVSINIIDELKKLV